VLMPRSQFSRQVKTLVSRCEEPGHPATG